MVKKALLSADGSEFALLYKEAGEYLDWCQKEGIVVIGYDSAWRKLNVEEYPFAHGYSGDGSNSFNEMREVMDKVESQGI